MCTLSWLPLPGGYALAFNRDERRTRSAAEPPSRREREGIVFLAPTDGDAGGTWITVNGRGGALALLNRWDETPHDAPGPFVSRGQLVLDLATLADPRAVDRRLSAMSLASWRPFTLACLAPDESPWVFEWNGTALTRGVADRPGLVRASSGYDQAGVERVRGELFREAAARKGGLTPEVLWRLHASHRPERGAYSICMHREEAATVSFSAITVTPDEVQFRYLDGPPGEGGAESALSIPRQ